MIRWARSYMRLRTGRLAASLHDLYGECDAEERRLPPEYFETYLAGQGTRGLTPLAGAREGPGILDGARRVAGSEQGDLDARLGAALDEAAGGANEVAVAVSSGIDCWLLAAMLKSRGYRVRGWLLVSGVPGYCEREAALSMATALGISCEEIRVTAEDFLDSLPEFVRVTETPVYNLHPVSKLLLARELRRLGIRAVITGDGADQVMRHDWDCDLLPLTHACFQSAGVEWIAPFLSDCVVAACGQPLLNKLPVRELAARYGVAAAAKRPAMFPEFGRSRREWLDHTCGLLLQSLEERHTCAASRA